MAMKDVSDLLVCQTVIEMHEDTVLPRANLIERLMSKTGQCEKVCNLAAMRCTDRAYIEYGVSVRRAWLTTKGRVLMERAAKSPSSN